MYMRSHSIWWKKLKFQLYENCISVRLGEYLHFPLSNLPSVAFQRQHCLQSKFLPYSFIIIIFSAFASFSKYYNFLSFFLSIICTCKRENLYPQKNCQTGENEGEWGKVREIGKILKMPFKCYADGASIFYGRRKTFFSFFFPFYFHFQMHFVDVWKCKFLLRGRLEVMSMRNWKF